MDFDALFAQVIALLQREQRISYRVLKRRFALSNDDLADLKDELIYAKKLAVDEENRVLVWTGTVEGTIETPAPPPQSIPSTPTQATPSVEPASPVMTSRTPEAERRQLTVMFIDIVESTSLSAQLDPEDLREVIQEYQQVCSEIINRFDGHVAQLLGDGLLIYFGYPVAHEDDPHRAVHTGLGILAAMGNLNTRLQQAKGIQLAIRIGVHTGLVVVGHMGSGGRQEQLALGETPNVAARIQGLAAPDTMAVSEATYRLVEGYFSCELLGEHALRGVIQPLQVYRVLGESGVHSRLDIVSARGLTPLVGRESEVTLLLERWQQAKAGHGQVVLLTGEGGIGKSRLVQVLKDSIASEPHTQWECRSAEYSQNTALFPLVELFQRLLRFQAEDTPDEKLVKLEQMLSQYRLPLEDSVQLFAPLFSLPLPDNRYPPLHLSPQRMRQRTLEALVAILLEQAEPHPLLFILEDLHWTDPSTLELLNLVIEQIPTTSILMLLTCRPTFQPSWSHRSYLSEITVSRLSHTQVEQIVTGITDGKTFPTAVLQQIIEKTDGVPLFVEEITKAILESGQLKALDVHYELIGSLSTFAIPATLQDSLMARLDRLMTGKVLAQLGATIGRQFSYELLRVVSQLDEATLQRELVRLVGAELVYQRGLPPQATYTFKHALIQDIAYESLLRSTRQEYHRRIAEVLKERFLDTQPDLLAYHYTEAGLNEQAVGYWHRAGQQAIRRSANVEAITHLNKGLELLKMLPDSPELIQQELVLLTALGPVLATTKGHGTTEGERTYRRAHTLCQQIEEVPQLIPVLRGLWNFSLARGEFRTAHEFAEQCLRIAQRAHEAALLVEAHWMMCSTLMWRGVFALALEHAEQGIALREPQKNAFSALQNPGVAFLSYGAVVLWYLGYPDRARVRSDEALSLAQKLSHPYSVIWSHFHAARVYQLRQDSHTVQEQADAVITAARAHGSQYFEARGTVLRGWALAEQGQGKAGIAQIHQGMNDMRASGSVMGDSGFLCMLANGYENAGQIEEGLVVLTEALAYAQKTEERVYEAEIHRLQGELLLTQSPDNQPEAETCFHHAISIAQSQQAKSWELRAATSLARLWQQQGKRQEAHDLLTPVYHWFTEGFDTADLKDAKALLDELA